MIPAFSAKNPGDLIPAALWNSNFNAVRTAFNNTAVLTDVARTVTVTHTYSASQTFSGGWTAGSACTISSGGMTITAGGLTVSAGTTAVQALTATTVNGQTISATAQFTGTLNVAGAVVLGSTLTVQGNLTAQLALTANTITVTAGEIGSTRVGPFVLFTVGAEVLRLGTNNAWRWQVGTDGHLTPFSTYNLGASGGRVGTVYATTVNTTDLTTSGTVSLAGGATIGTGLTVSAGTTAIQALTATTGSFSSTLAAGNTTITGTLSVSSTINGQTISSGAQFTGTMLVAGETRVGSANALSSNATSGFFWFPTMNGNPTGNPTDTDQRAAAVYNYSNNTLHIRNPFDDTWRSVALA